MILNILILPMNIVNPPTQTLGCYQFFAHPQIYLQKELITNWHQYINVMIYYCGAAVIIMVRFSIIIGYILQIMIKIDSGRKFNL